MSRRSLVLGLMLAFTSVSYAQQISEQQAYEAALQFLSSGQNAQKAPTRDSQSLKMSYTASTGSDNDLYVFNREGGGFVIVSADARTVKPVLGYSDNGRFDAANMPPQLQDILTQYQQEINYARENLAPRELLLQNDSTERKVIVEPLIKTKWDQGEPYNGLCPMDGGRRTYAGCVATTMAQVMNYWRWPERGMGSHRDFRTDSLYVDFSKSVYDWDNMAITYTADTPQVKIDAVQKLMYDCGISVDTEYTKDGSGAEGDDIIKALVCYFDYQGRYISRSDYETEWDSLIASELDAGRPVIYGGYTENSDAGHAFICDGYDSENYFHFNIGWSGYCDGYYLTTAVNVNVYSFNTGQVALIGVYPDYEDRYSNVYINCYLNIIGDAVLSDIKFPIDTFDLVLPDSILIDGVQYPIKVIKDEFMCNMHEYCTSFVSSETLEYIGMGAFYGSKSLQNVYISSSVQKIVNGAFGDCDNLKAITVSESSPYYYSPQGSNVIIERSTGRLVQVCNYSVIPSEKITVIGENAFDGLDSLTVVRLPESVKVIENDAFANCSNLKEIYFGTAVCYLGDRLFGGCPSLTDVYFYSDTPPVITTPSDIENPSIPYGCTIHVKPSALENYRWADLLRSYNIVADIPETTAVPAVSVPQSRSDSQYYDLQGRPVQPGYRGLKIQQGRKTL